MNTHYTLTLCLLVAATGCASIQEDSENTECSKKTTDEVFYATLEQSGGADATKVYADENLKVLWNADDCITIFNRYTYGDEYAFQGVTGDTAGAFTKEDDDAEFVTGNPLDKIYSVYPYRTDNKINNTGDLSITWPSPQTYKADSFGIGANVMVSVTDNNQLRFRNVGGYLALKLYGDNVSVSSITLRGNNGEKLSGRATVTCASEANPVLSFQSASSESLRLECTSPVHLGSTAESATTFWLVVPPTDFTQGFNITVRTSDGRVFFKSTDLAYDIERNTLTRMAAVEVVPGDIIPFEDANFKAYCVENFDTSGDGEISITEALAVTSIDVNTDNIVSLQGVEFFENLEVLDCLGSWNSELSCGNGILTSLDVSNNAALTNLKCWNNQLTTLDVSNNIALTRLHCGRNQLATLNVKSNTALKRLSCNDNQLSTLDVSSNTLLTGLYFENNQLITLDISSNTALNQLECWNNQLTALDVSNNTELTYIDCSNNHLTSLDVSNNTALEILSCHSNQLTTLDISNNTELFSLNCSENQLTTLDMSNNTALEGLDCSYNLLTTLDFSNNTAITLLDCNFNQLTALSMAHNTNLINLGCIYNQLTTLDLSNNTALEGLYCYGNQLTTLDVSHNATLTNLHCSENPFLTEIWLQTGQSIETFDYDSSVAQIYYKD